ncbi:hypothetical protein BDM02DRAFT_996226 [Thelephora ganbajun]|uniref:Uncharacterized protein n=1 Tax=Thelephora ganbajun TaxID=370292 RepID=A0ACB6Z3P4_THEGA|nr:hypothetical protein BDM02DRAFT_996226 [Thelephora ganbajun]
MALAKVNKFAKEDLKRSVSGFFYCVFVHRFTNLSIWQQPLRGTKAGEGKRSRNVEKYLEGLLEAIRRVAPTPIPVGGGSDESDTAVAALSRLADELEAKLAVVNQQPAFRQSTSAPESRKKTDSEKAEQQLKKNGSEKARRDDERHHVKRISRLFEASKKPWSKRDALGLAVIFLLYGPTAFPTGFVEVRR